MFQSSSTTTQSPNPHRPAADPRPSAPARQLDDLLSSTPEQLHALYLDARVPHLEEVVGDLRGRMLANVVMAGAAAEALVRFASSDVFPWRGKSFAPYSRDAGEGINRVVSDRRRYFPFGTFIGPSRAGDFDALQLDYDRRDNPWLIRQIRDEIRQLRPGLYLGQAYLAVPRERLVLYFGLTSDAATSRAGAQ